MRRPIVFGYGITIALCGLFLINTTNSLAQTYPNKPIHIVVPFPPGGGVDVVARVVGRKLNESLSQPVVIENRGGAAGTLGAEYVAKASADGHTIGLFTSTLLMTPALQKVPYDAHKDFAPIILFATVPNILVVHPSLPARNLNDLLQLARNRPGQLTHGTSGPGSVPHLMMELLGSMVPQFAIVHVPYKGNAQAITDLLGGHITMHISSMISATPYISNHKLRAIAVTSGKRSRAAPRVPTFAESGAAGYDVSSLWGFLAPAQTAVDVTQKLYTEIGKILRVPEVNDHLASQGADISGASPSEYLALMKIELARWPKVVASAKIQIQ